MGGWIDILLTAAHVSLATSVTVHAVTRKRDSRAAIGWTALAWLAPIIGSLAYYVLGVNRIQRTATRLGVSDELKDNPTFQPSDAEFAQAEGVRTALPALAGLSDVGATLTGKPVLPGNTVDCLQNGDETYPAMIAAIDAAEHSVGLLSYIFDSDRAGDALVEALLRAQGRGVAVRVLIDHVGSKYSKIDTVRRLREAGIDAASFLPSKFGRLPVFANLRNHRKILIVDGAIGFTGGTNIREAHWLGLDPATQTQCLHFRITGPVVSQMKEVFVTDWAFTTGETLRGPGWFPELKRTGPVWARGIAHGPDEDFESLSKVMFAALAVAKHRVRIVSPYFLPDARLQEALAVAALRGVRVDIYLPSDNNVAIVEWAAMAQLPLILEQGCRVWRTRPPFDHTKLMLVDDMWTLIGSTNWDPRSLRLNFEFNVECYDPDLSSRLHEIVDAKAEGAEEITAGALAARPFPVQLRDGLARLLSPYL